MRAAVVKPGLWPTIVRVSGVLMVETREAVRKAPATLRQRPEAGCEMYGALDVYSQSRTK